jgi:hypothetical protein
LLAAAIRATTAIPARTTGAARAKSAAATTAATESIESATAPPAIASGISILPGAVAAGRRRCRRIAVCGWRLSRLGC